jgi:hypothetical protein
MVTKTLGQAFFLAFPVPSIYFLRVITFFGKNGKLTPLSIVLLVLGSLVVLFIVLKFLALAFVFVCALIIVILVHVLMGKRRG